MLDFCGGYAIIVVERGMIMNLIKYSVKLVKEQVLEYDTEITTPTALFEVAQRMLEDETQEVLLLIALDNRHRPVGLFEVHRGTVNRASVSPRDIFIRLFSCNAVNFFIAHNHPSGSCIPSGNDTELTKALIGAGEMLDLPLLDHVIIGDKDNRYSFRQKMTYLWK